MSLIPGFVFALLLALLGSIQVVGIPDPIIQGLFGVAIICMAALMRRGHVQRWFKRDS